MQPGSDHPATDAITYAQFAAVYRALARANCQGRIVDTALDVTWSLYGVTGELNVAASQAQLLAAVSRWLGDHGLPVLYIWAIEEGATFGLHAHMTLHLPAAHEATFRAFLISYLPEVVSDPALLAPASPGVPFLLQVNGGETTYHQWRRFRYMLKSVDPRVDLNGVEARNGQPTLTAVCGIHHSFGGFMRIARCGVAPALSDAAKPQRSSGMVPPVMTIGSDNPPAFDDRYLDWHAAYGVEAEPARQG